MTNTTDLRERIAKLILAPVPESMGETYERVEAILALISRPEPEPELVAEADDALEELADRARESDLGHFEPADKLKEKVQTALKQSITATSGEQWRPIESARPVEFVDLVLLSRNKGKRAVLPAVYDGEKWLSISIGGLIPFKNPTHWMPLPDAPTGVEMNG